MCGIAGFIDFKKQVSNQKNILESMTKTLEYRGPNSDGFYVSNNVMLGHRRLIVVDPEGGIQPMKRMINGHEYVLIYNGELYNTEDLRAELLKEGYKFEGYSDTEVLLVSYIAWGIKAIEKFNGIFAFAINL